MHNDSPCGTGGYRTNVNYFKRELLERARRTRMMFKLILMFSLGAIFGMMISACLFAGGGHDDRR